MKKIIFGSVAAITSVMGIHTLRAEKSMATYYWFTYMQFNSVGMVVKPGASLVTGDFISFPATEIMIKPSISCPLGDSAYCKEAFTEDQLTFTAMGSKIAGIKGFQIPVQYYQKSKS